MPSPTRFTQRLAQGASGSVLAALSGGVDSAVMALTLTRAGFKVTGATMLLLDGADEQASLDAAQDARTLCDGLGIDFLPLDCRSAFARQVIDPFCDAYLSGETPNPCIACNRHLKFDLLHCTREELGLDYLATGHYARRAFNPETGRFEIRRGQDPAKDQSYVLYQLTQEQLAHTLFPLGEQSKEITREMARDAGLAVAQKPESQDICFVPHGDHLRFILERTGAQLEPGPIVDAGGNVLGRHHGLAAYTIGQRKGLGVAHSEPLFVLRKDLNANTLVVGTRAQQGVKTVRANEVNLVARERIDKPLRVTAKTHYRMKAAPATAWMDEDGSLAVEFDEPVRACAPGQSLVIYEGDAVTAGGIITS